MERINEKKTPEQKRIEQAVKSSEAAAAARRLAEGIATGGTMSIDGGRFTSDGSFVRHSMDEIPELSFTDGRRLVLSRADLQDFVHHMAVDEVMVIETYDNMYVEMWHPASPEEYEAFQRQRKKNSREREKESRRQLIHRMMQADAPLAAVNLMKVNFSVEFGEDFDTGKECCDGRA